MPKVVLAYTGSLATSLCIHWLRMKKGFDVVSFTANVGQGVNLEPIGERALGLGAESAHICDLRERFLRDFAFAGLRAGAVYESGDFLGTALTRPLIVREMAKIAAEDRCEFIAHGCAGRGNDRVRFEMAAAALAPHLKLIAPLEEWGLCSREEQIRYARRYGMGPGGELPIAGAGEGGVAPEASDEIAFASVDQNLWGIARPSDAAQVDPWAPVPESAYRMTVDPTSAPDQPVELRIGFRRGIPVRLDDRSLRPVPLVEELNRIAGAHGVGRADTIEDRISGTKTRLIYEAPAATVLYQAHRALETLVLPKGLLQFKGILSRKYAQIVYEGLWWSDLREALDAFFGRAAQKVTGEVRVRLYKGRATVVGVRSPYSLYDKALARAAAEESEADEFDGIRDALGYALKVASRRDGGREGFDAP